MTTLESAADLPLAARTSYRFREPSGPARRSAWDARLRDQSDQELETTADVFGRLAAEDPNDAAAWYNRRFVSPGWARTSRRSVAWTAWSVSRQSGRSMWPSMPGLWPKYSAREAVPKRLPTTCGSLCTINWNPGETSWLLEEFPEIQRVPTPRAPGATIDENSEIEVFEWLDRPFSESVIHSSAVVLPPTVLASVYIKAQSLRLSSPRVGTLEQIEESLLPRLSDGGGSIRREASPLPLPFLDADVWVFRIPPISSPIGPTCSGASQSSGTLRTSGSTAHATDSTAERRWQPRSPRIGVTPSRAKLTAVIRLREQLGNRPSALLLYQGYPFDRLRRRLGLEMVYPGAVDPEDFGCASAVELDRLDPAAIDDTRLVEAFTSAAGLKEDALTGAAGGRALEAQTDRT